MMEQPDWDKPRDQWSDPRTKQYKPGEIIEVGPEFFSAEAAAIIAQQAKAEAAYPDNNPKTAVGVTKVPLHLVPPVAAHYTALAFADGAKKYGPYNWREKKVSTSVYVSAAKRHLDAFWDGEDVSQDALVHHLGHVMACCAIILDGMSIGMLNDDRPAKGAAARLQAEYANKDKNDGQVSTNPLSASNRQEPVQSMEGRSGTERDMGRNGGPLYAERRYSESDLGGPGRGHPRC